MIIASKSEGQAMSSKKELKSLSILTSLVNEGRLKQICWVMIVIEGYTGSERLFLSMKAFVKDESGAMKPAFFKDSIGDLSRDVEYLINAIVELNQDRTHQGGKALLDIRKWLQANLSVDAKDIRPSIFVLDDTLLQSKPIISH